VAASNRVGADDYGTYKGHSIILNPYGMTMGKCRSRRQGSITAELDAEMIVKLRMIRG
jgi:predicted amidohydrolase